MPRGRSSALRSASSSCDARREMLWARARRSPWPGRSWALRLTAALSHARPLAQGRGDLPRSCGSRHSPCRTRRETPLPGRQQPARGRLDGSRPSGRCQARLTGDLTVTARCGSPRRRSCRSASWRRRTRSCLERWSRQDRARGSPATRLRGLAAATRPSVSRDSSAARRSRRTDLGARGASARRGRGSPRPAARAAWPPQAFVRDATGSPGGARRPRTRP